MEMRLRELREDRDFTQSDIAQVLNCKQNTYQQYESGKRQIPLEALIKLCEFYGVSADYILELPKGLEYPER
ncbi:MAG: helix-turn-helix transcriptional regulator [Clostridia bacterium]|nr:helix-turn-helix transcriptional regulator [Clostridia bacterium]